MTTVTEVGDGTLDGQAAGLKSRLIDTYRRQKACYWCSYCMEAHEQGALKHIKYYSEAKHFIVWQYKFFFSSFFYELMHEFPSHQILKGLGVYKDGQISAGLCFATERLGITHLTTAPGEGS